MPSSVLEAIREGFWDYEPPTTEDGRYPATEAMPGSKAKLDILAERLAHGLPLWHPEDRTEYDMPETPSHRAARKERRAVADLLSEA